jgi:hypothetical protein
LPERAEEIIQVGNALALMKPTAHLRWFMGELQQWFEGVPNVL